MPQGEYVSIVEGQRQTVLLGAPADIAAGDQSLQLRKIVDVIAANADIELHLVEAAIVLMATLVEVEDPVATITLIEDDQIGSLAGPDPVFAGTAKHSIVALTG